MHGTGAGRTIGVRRSVVALVLAGTAWGVPGPVRSAEVTAKGVLDSIAAGTRFLKERQEPDGSWRNGNGQEYTVGATSLVVLSFVNCGLPLDDPAVSKGLAWLRKAPDPKSTYETALLISVLATAKDGNRDTLRIKGLAGRLERAQIKDGPNAGSWSYGVEEGGINLGGDRSNGQFAVLGLYEAASAGIPVDRNTWILARNHWTASQSGDGGWGYAGLRGGGSTGSMTAAGISTMTIVTRMLREARDDLDASGRPKCCGAPEPSDSLNRGLAWMQQSFSAGHNPGGNAWYLYYLYGLERAGRLSGIRFFKDGHDWYREGAAHLLGGQNGARGYWAGVGPIEQDPIVGTSFALLFLSKGMSPVVVQKLKYPTQRAGVVDKDDLDWNLHRDDVRNLTDHLGGLPRWPKLLTSQILDVTRLQPDTAVSDLAQSPVLYLAGREAPVLDDRQVQWLRAYLDQGGFLVAAACCGPASAKFDAAMHALVARLYPEGDAKLQPLPADHPVYRSEYVLDPESNELHGVDFGCRTPILYSPPSAPLDLSCLWDKWARHHPPGRTDAAKAMIDKAVRVGVNIVAYATGREPPNRLEQPTAAPQVGAQDRIDRGFLQVAKIRHTGAWDAAPHAVRNLLAAVNQTVGLAASTKPRSLLATDPNLFRYPLAYMHGLHRFTLGQSGRDQLKLYLQRGGVLFADACCGSKAFDESFRKELETALDAKFERIPVDHEIFTSKVGYDLKTVKRRIPGAAGGGGALEASVEQVEPWLEGIRIEDRWAVIYSKYDLSCALERQASVACAGYVPDDAVKIAVNVVLYALLQDARYAPEAATPMK